MLEARKGLDPHLLAVFNNLTTADMAVIANLSPEKRVFFLERQAALEERVSIIGGVFGNIASLYQEPLHERMLRRTLTWKQAEGKLQHAIGAGLNRAIEQVTGATEGASTDGVIASWVSVPAPTNAKSRPTMFASAQQTTQAATVTPEALADAAAAVAAGNCGELSDAKREAAEIAARSADLKRRQALGQLAPEEKEELRRLEARMKELTAEADAPGAAASTQKKNTGFLGANAPMADNLPPTLYRTSVTNCNLQLLFTPLEPPQLPKGDTRSPRRTHLSVGCDYATEDDALPGGTEVDAFKSFLLRRSTPSPAVVDVVTGAKAAALRPRAPSPRVPIGADVRPQNVQDPPPSFLCPISLELMLDPVICADGQSYERDNIVAWLDENNTSPVTGLPFPSRALIPNYALRDAIDDWDDAQLQPSQRHSPWNVDELFEAFPAPKLPPFPSAPDGDRKVTLKQLESRYNTAWQQHLQILQQEAAISDALAREYGVLSHTQSFRPSPGASVRPTSVAQTQVHVDITAPLPIRTYDAAAISAVAARIAGVDASRVITTLTPRPRPPGGPGKDTCGPAPLPSGGTRIEITILAISAAEATSLESTLAPTFGDPMAANIALEFTIDSTAVRLIDAALPPVPPSMHPRSARPATTKPTWGVLSPRLTSTAVPRSVRTASTKLPLGLMSPRLASMARMPRSARLHSTHDSTQESHLSGLSGVYLGAGYGPLSRGSQASERNAFPMPIPPSSGYASVLTALSRREPWVDAGDAPGPPSMAPPWAHAALSGHASRPGTSVEPRGGSRYHREPESAALNRATSPHPEPVYPALMFAPGLPSWGPSPRSRPNTAQFTAQNTM